MSYDVSVAVCNEDKCKASVKRHRWAQIRAHGEGWYFQKDGTVWCPKHRPTWAPKR